MILAKSNAWKLMLLGFLVGVACYYQGLSGPFLFDDHHVIQDNSRIKVDSLGVDELRVAADSYIGRTRQLSMLSFALNHYFFGNSTWAYKAVTLGIHLAVGLLFYYLTRLIIAGALARGTQRADRLVAWAPAMITAIWVVSPINLTSVLYISQRMTVLSALFIAAGVAIYVKGRLRHMNGGSFSLLSATGVIVCLLAAYASKENGILLIPLLLTVELVLFGFIGRDGSVSRRLILGIFSLGVLAIVVVVISGVVSLADMLDGYKVRPFTLEERLLTQPRVLLFYVGLVFFPAVGQFGLWHDDIPVSTSLLSPPDTLLSIVVVICLLVIAIAVRKRHVLVSLGIAWYFVGHSLESTIVPLEMVHEHRNYVPSYGILLALVGGLMGLSNVREKLKLTLLGLLFVSASFNLYQRANDWSSFGRHAAAEFLNHPNSARAAYHLANVSTLLAARGVVEAREIAYELYERASTLDSDSILPDIGMVLATNQFEQTYDPYWVENATRKLRSTGGLPSDVAAFKGIRYCTGSDNCEFFLDDFKPLYEAAAESENFKLVIEAAIFYHTALGESDHALSLLERAMHMAPREPAPRLNYISALAEMGQKEKARELFLTMEADGVRGLRIEKDWVEQIRSNLGIEPG